MQEFVLLILLNLPNGQQVVQSAIPTPGDQCFAMQESIWNGPNEIAWTDSDGPAPMIDSACAIVPACETEDDSDCIWRADTSGNGVGRSFVDVDGIQFPIVEPRP